MGHKPKWTSLLISLISMVTCVLLCGITHPRSVRAEITAEQVNDAIDRAVRYLKTEQDARKGSWPTQVTSSEPGGITALCVLALLNTGLDADDPAVQSGLNYLRNLGNPERMYATSLQTMVFCLAEPEIDEILIRRNVDWLVAAQKTKGANVGGWDYELDRGLDRADESCSQFAVLALHEASRVGVPVPQQTWLLADRFWKSRQDSGGRADDGGWKYRNAGGARGSMTCAGISSLAILDQNLGQGDAWVIDGRVACCGIQENNDAIVRGLDWLAQGFSVSHHPGARNSHQFYYLYSLERAGRLTGRRFIGNHDWYREGADYLVRAQDKLSGAWPGDPPINEKVISTSFSLLFLAKGRRPVLMSKLRRPGTDDWNRHRSDVINLTRYVEKRWQRKLNWQVIDLRAATANDLRQSPVLYLSGRDELELTGEEKEHLRQYVTEGGFIFAENCCNGQGFDRQFRQLMEELFPDNPLRTLPPTHPIWYAEQKVDPKYMRPLLGIDACCRTGVVYCPKDLGCFWELARGTSHQLPDDVQAEMEACLAIGVNVLAYATNRELRDKLDVPEVASDDSTNAPEDRGTLYVAKLDHGGGSDDAPAALTNLMRTFGDQLKARVNLDRRLLSPTDPNLPDYPVLFIHGRESFHWNDAQRQSIAKFVRNGGVIFGDAICASEPFADAFRREIKAIFPKQEYREIPPSHPMFTREYRGFDLSKLRLRDLNVRATDDAPLEGRVREVSPRLEGVEQDGRFVVIFSPLDISCALESSGSLDCLGYVREDAAKLGINILLYALQP
ncbi:MAG: DUF4159 domain-containing protein [Planctomycetales bacterium]|nr:DUF4159 domain-containing protein [Planctomycetales bacterium]